MFNYTELVQNYGDTVMQNDKPHFFLYRMMSDRPGSTTNRDRQLRLKQKVREYCNEAKLPDRNGEMLASCAATLLSSYNIGDSLESRLDAYVSEGNLDVSEQHQQAIIFLIDEAYAERSDRIQKNNGSHIGPKN